MAKAAIGQICSSNSMMANLAQCVKLVGQAAKAGAKILFLPEASDYIGTSAQESLSLARPLASSPFVTGLQSAAAQHSIAVHVGVHVPVSVPVSISSPPPASATSTTATTGTGTRAATGETTTKLHNRTIYISADGTLQHSASYDKLHLFDYANLRESSSTQAGSKLIAPIPSPIGRLGSLICFDLRFPEPAVHLTARPHTHLNSTEEKVSKGEKEKERQDEPAQILLYPSAFTVATGRAHWEVLLRARAIETQSYVIAAAQAGAHNLPPSPSSPSTSPSSSLDMSGKKPRVSYGHSMVVDPWGRVILELKGVRPNWDGEDARDAVEDGAIGELGVVDIDLEEWARVREKMPLVRRIDVYPEV
ncbi:carbon-nitrogen hydrolase [Nemania sp. FL0916]|nr:carbon-nitrogen hydrolase [Nemania sp. FL0916]